MMDESLKQNGSRKQGAKQARELYFKRYYTFGRVLRKLVDNASNLVTGKGARFVASQELRNTLDECCQYSGNVTCFLGKAFSGYELNDQDQWLPYIGTSLPSTFRSTRSPLFLFPHTTPFNLSSASEAFYSLFVRTHLAHYDFASRHRHRPTDPSNLPDAIRAVLETYQALLKQPLFLKESEDERRGVERRLDLYIASGSYVASWLGFLLSFHNNLKPYINTEMNDPTVPWKREFLNVMRSLKKTADFYWLKFKLYVANDFETALKPQHWMPVVLKSVSSTHFYYDASPSTVRHLVR